MNKKQNLVWIDLEMTGLHPAKNTILEIGMVITNSTLDIVYEGIELVIYQSEKDLAVMDKWAKNVHTQSGLVDQVRQSTISLVQAEQKIVEIIKQFCEPRTALLCGNSIWQDRAFLYHYMPQIVEYLHYRQIDVTSFKELISRWYPHNLQAIFHKKETHRALEDIRQSIAELRHYKKYFLI